LSLPLFIMNIIIEVNFRMLKVSILYIINKFFSNWNFLIFMEKFHCFYFSLFYCFYMTAKLYFFALCCFSLCIIYHKSSQYYYEKYIIVINSCCKTSKGSETVRPWLNVHKFYYHQIS
jgi:hypothetical protein